MVYSHVNAKGKVFLRVLSPDGTGAVKLWWTKGPSGKNKHLGRQAGDIAIDIEGFLWGKLKVQAVGANVVIQITDDPSVKHNFPTISF